MTEKVGFRAEPTGEHGGRVFSGTRPLLCLAYRDRKRSDRRIKRDELTRQAVEEGLYDVEGDVHRQVLADDKES